MKLECLNFTVFKILVEFSEAIINYPLTFWYWLNISNIRCSEGATDSYCCKRIVCSLLQAPEHFCFMTCLLICIKFKLELKKLVPQFFDRLDTFENFAFSKKSSFILSDQVAAQKLVACSNVRQSRIEAQVLYNVLILVVCKNFWNSALA